MDIPHTVKDNPSNLLQTLVRPHGAYRCPLHQDVTLRQQLDRLRILRFTNGSNLEASLAFSVLPSGPMILCRLFTKRSLLETTFPILMMSHATASSRILTACVTLTPRASNLIKSRALRMMYGSYVLRVVRTDMEPWIKSRVHAIPCAAYTLVS